MSHPLRCRFCYIEMTLSLFLALFLSAPLSVQSTPRSTEFSFPVFPSADGVVTFGQTWYNSQNLSFMINPHVPTAPEHARKYCVKLLYPEKVQMKTRKSSAMASFSTSFTFSITSENQSSTARSGWESLVCGFAFTIVTETFTSLFLIPGSNGSDPIRYLQVEFDNYKSFGDEDPSDNHIGVNLNNCKSVYTYNLCGGNSTTCSYPWNGRTYSARIDYNGSTKSLELWFANGSLADVNLNPSLPALFKVPELDLMDTFQDYMYVGFSGYSGSFLDTYEILSWHFNSSFADQPNPGTKSSSRRNIIIIFTACGSTAILVSISLLRYRKRHSHRKEPSRMELELLIGLRRYSFKELKKATNSFNDSALLGKGSSGSVYKGTLTRSGRAVAVKRFTYDSEHVEREFLAEVSSISQIRHRNLVHLQGWCHEERHFLLVFDYMSNGSLDEWLFPGRRRHPRDPKYRRHEILPFELRVSIVAGVAAAVEYLHEEWVQLVLHRDIKSSNVLLDADFNPHLGDFGLARLIDHEKLDKTTVMAGTLGYMAPEMHFTGKATKQSDVYSFGILLLEVVCGRKAVNLQVENPDENYLLVQHVWRALEGGNILDAVLPALLNAYSQEQNPSSASSTGAVSFQLPNPSRSDSEIVPEVNSSNTAPEVERTLVCLLQLGLQCCSLDPEARPSMRVVKQAILQVRDSGGQDAMTMLSSMPPLPSTMPGYGSVGQGFKPPIQETELERRDSASFVASSDTMSMLRRRFHSADNEIPD